MQIRARPPTLGPQQPGGPSGLAGSASWAGCSAANAAATVTGSPVIAAAVIGDVGCGGQRGEDGQRRTTKAFGPYDA